MKKPDEPKSDDVLVDDDVLHDPTERNIPLTPEEALARIKELASAGRIEFSPSEGIEALRSYVDTALAAIGYPDAWVSDHSCVGDFRLDKDGSREEFAATVSGRLGMIVECGDYIVEVARRMKEKGSA